MKKSGKKRFWILTLLLLVGLLAAGCSQSKNTESSDQKNVTENVETKDEEKQQEDAIPDDGRFHGEYIVTGEYAKDKVGDENVVFVDARGWKKAILGTIEGAVATTWTDLSTCGEGKAGDENWGKIPDPDDLEGRLGELGISKEKEIILIADTIDGWGDDARILWELLAAGYEDVKMIDGGYEAAKQAGAETQFLASSADPCEVEIDEIDNTHIITTEELQKNYDQYKIVDVRTEDEYNGATPNGEAKGGHMPGAILVKYTDLFQEDGTLKSNKELEAMFEAAGLDKGDNIVTYCTGGIRSAYTQLVLEMCGYENTWNYDQSYWRWCVVGEVE